MLRRAVLVVPGICLGLFGARHFADGRAIDAAVPVPTYMVARTSMPKMAYLDAAAALASANPQNGSAKIARGEAMMRAGEPPVDIIPVLIEGLSAAPASARGWTLLAEDVAAAHKGRAAGILGQALLLAPRDYWLAGMRAHDAALLWPELDAETRTLAMSQTRLLWHEDLLRPQLLVLANTTEGATLITRSFPADDIRAINRWLVDERSQAQ